MKKSLSKISLAISTIGLLSIFLSEFTLVEELIKPHIENHSGDYMFIVNLIKIVTLIFLIFNITVAFYAKRYQQRHDGLALILAFIVFALYWMPWAELYINNCTTYDINFRKL